MYKGKKLDGGLFEKCYSEKNGEYSVLGAINKPAQVAFTLLLGGQGCFHAI